MALAVDTKVFPSHFDHHAFPVHGLQQSRSEEAMHFNGTADDLFSELLDLCKSGRDVHCGSTKRAGMLCECFRMCEVRSWHYLHQGRTPDSGKIAAPHARVGDSPLREN